MEGSGRHQRAFRHQRLGQEVSSLPYYGCSNRRLTHYNRYKWAPLKTRKMVYTPMQQKSILDNIPKPNTQGKTNQ
jgi:hypothetical protein